MPHRFHGDRTQTRKGGRYDRTHQRARAAAARRHHDADPCARCGHQLGPMSRHLHYDHDEHGGYLGFSHAACNLRAGAIKGNQAQGNQAGPIKPRRCRTCSTRFQPHNIRQQHCSQACREAATPPAQRTQQSRDCTECGTTFTMTVGNRLTCTPQCGKARTERLKNDPRRLEARREAAIRYRNTEHGREAQRRARDAHRTRTRTW